MQDFQKVSKGQSFEIPANAYNAFVDAANANRNKMNIQSTLNNKQTQPYILVNNTTGDDIGQFRVMGLNGVTVLTPDASGPKRDLFTSNPVCFNGITILQKEEPHTFKQITQFCVTQEPIASGEIGKAIVHGYTFCYIMHGTGNIGKALEYATIYPDYPTCLVNSGYGQAQILWEEELVETEHLAYLNLTNHPVRFVVATADISDGSMIEVKYANSDFTDSEPSLDDEKFFVYTFGTGGPEE
jgi:hypothetical protein